jgi:integrase
MYARAYISGSGIGSVPLARVDGPRLTAFYAELLAGGRRQAEGGLSAKMVRNVHGMLHKALADAVRWGRLVRNAADAADQPRKSSPEMQVWTPEEMRTFLEHVRDDRLFAAWQLLATTGMRRGELLGLRWADVDFERGSLTIRQVRTAVDYAVETGTPKTHKGTRTVSLDPATLAGLRAHRRRQNEERLVWDGAWTETGLVFVRPDGSAIHPQRLSQWFAQHVRHAGLPKIRLHDVRHSYATAVIRAGVPLKVVSQRIGHANPTITMTTYQHVLPGDDEQAALIGARTILGS